jgi:N-acyl-D-amino-acid deacylase
MGYERRSPTQSELDEMKRLVAESMQSGAYGLSSGLIYAPGSYAQTDELTELARTVAEYHGIYTTHMRSESEDLLPSIQEAITVGEKAGLRVQISHFKVSGKKNWGKSEQAIALITAARQRGLEITADQYPYNAGSTGLFALLPPDVLSEGVETLSKRLQEASFRKNLYLRMTDHINAQGMLPEASYDRILIASSPHHPDFEGKSLAEIAQKLDQDPLELIFDLVAEERLTVTMVIFTMHEDDIRRIMQTEFVMMGSDGLPSLGTRIHPRMSGTAPRILGRYSREQGIFSLEQAVRKMTSLPAQTFRLKGKGLLKEGFDADLVIFNPAEILDGATYDAPNTPPVGIEHVIVNGVPAVEANRVLGARSGKVLRYGG